MSKTTVEWPSRGTLKQTATGVYTAENGVTQLYMAQTTHWEARIYYGIFTESSVRLATGFGKSPEIAAADAEEDLLTQERAKRRFLEMVASCKLSK